MGNDPTSLPLIVRALGPNAGRARRILESPREDEGFFPADSVARKVLASPTVGIGALRCSIVEMLDPPSAVALGQHSLAYQDPWGRAIRSLTLIAYLVFGDKKTALHASDVWYRVHERINGVLPGSDQPYRALDLDNLLWVFLTGWHSFYKCYQEFAPTKLTDEEIERYFAEGAAAGAMMGIPEYLIPNTLEKVVKYFEEVKPELVLTPEGQDIVNLLVRPGTRPRLMILANPFLRLGSIAAVSSLPKDLRKLGNFDHPWLVDRTARGVVRAAMWAASARMAFPLLAVVAPDVWALVTHSRRWDPAAAVEASEPDSTVASVPDDDVKPEYEQRHFSQLSAM